MLHNTSRISGTSVHATDGAVGHLEDVLFHDVNWTVEYIVVDTGPWILGRKLICSPGHVSDVDEEGKRVSFSLTMDQLKESPELEADLPVSELKRREFDKYEKGPVYWSGSGVRKESFPPGAMPAQHEEAAEEKQEVEGELYGKHLRSAGEVVGYGVEAADDKRLGKVVGLLFDDDWSLRYIVVEIAGAEPPRLQIYSPDWVDSIRWIERAVRIRYAHEVAVNAPPLEADAMVTREYEKKLYDYYELEAQ